MVHNGLVSGIEFVSTRVSHKTPSHSRHGFELGLWVPKSSESHNGHFQARPWSQRDFGANGGGTVGVVVRRSHQ